MSADSTLSIHTFGRDHIEPSTLPTAEQSLTVAPSSSVNWHEARHTGNDAGLPDDFDHLVRSIGEW